MKAFKSHRYPLGSQWTVLFILAAFVLIAGWGLAQNTLADNGANAAVQSSPAASFGTALSNAGALDQPLLPAGGAAVGWNEPHFFVVAGRLIGAPAGGHLWVQLRGTNGVIVNESAVDIEGHYRFVHVLPDYYLVRVEDENQHPIRLWGGAELTVLPDNDEAVIEHDVRLESAPATDSESSPTKPQATGQITGVVTAADTGLPLQNVVVFASPAYGTSSIGVSTDSAGRYAISGLAPDSYLVKFKPSVYSVPAYAPLWYANQAAFLNSTLVNVIDGGTTPNINAVVPIGGQIKGQVLDAGSSLPINGVDVEVETADGQYVNDVQTDLSGHYTAPGLVTGTYRIKFDAKGYSAQYYNNKLGLLTSDPVQVNISTTVSAINAALNPGTLISGRVTASDTGLPLQSIQVSLYDDRETSLVSVSSKPTGYYTLTAQPAGHYRLRFFDSNNGYLSQFYNGEMSLLAADRISVTTPGVFSGVDVALQRGGQITGTVSTSDGGPLPTFLSLQAVDCNGNIYSGLVDLNGQYSIVGLPSGAYRVGYDTSGGQSLYANQYFNGHGSLASSDWITISAPGLMTNVNFSLQPGAVITGRVTGSDTGLGLSYPNVRAFDSSGKRIGHQSSDSAGNYVITGLPTGAAYVLFRPTSPDAYIPEYYGHQPTLATAVPVTVTAPYTITGINTVLQRGGQIAGRLTNSESGSPTYDSSGTVMVYDSNGMLVQTKLIGVAGYRTYGLAPGSYRIFVQPSPYNLAIPSHIQTFYNHQFSLASANPVTVAGANLIAGVNIALDRGTPLAGYVTDAVSGQPHGWVQITVYNANGNPVAASLLDSSTYPGGPFLTTGVPNGNYRVGFTDIGTAYRCNPSPYFTQFYNGKATLAGADAIPVAAPNTAGNINAALVQANQEVFLPMLTR